MPWYMVYRYVLMTPISVYCMYSSEPYYTVDRPWDTNTNMYSVLKKCRSGTSSKWYRMHFPVLPTQVENPQANRIFLTKVGGKWLLPSGVEDWSTCRLYWEIWQMIWIPGRTLRQQTTSILAKVSLNINRAVFITGLLIL